MNLLIGTPTVHGRVMDGYAQALSELARVCVKHHFPMARIAVDTCDIITSRNMIVMKFLGMTEWSHLLFIDGDSQVIVHAFDKLLLSGHDFAALPFCKREIDIDRLLAAARSPEGYSKEQCVAQALTWCLDMNAEPTPVQNGWMEIRRTGFGCVLLSRELLTKIGGGWFDRIMMNGTLLSEDMSFCERAREHTKLMLLVNEPTWHVGSFQYGGRFIDDPRYFSKQG